MDHRLQEPLRIALAELLRSVASAQVHLAAGNAADEEGYLQQVRSCCSLRVQLDRVTICVALLTGMASFQRHTMAWSEASRSRTGSPAY